MEKIYDLECRDSLFVFVTSREGEVLGWSETYGGNHQRRGVFGPSRFGYVLFVLVHGCDVDCEIGVEGAKYLKEMLMSKPIRSLTELNLSGMELDGDWTLGNALTDDGFAALLDVIVSGSLPNLRYINVDGEQQKMRFIFR